MNQRIRITMLACLAASAFALTTSTTSHAAPTYAQARTGTGATGKFKLGCNTTPTTVSCQDTSATFTLRAFIPFDLPDGRGGRVVGPWDVPKPFLGCRFFGDGRRFSDDPNASARQSNMVAVPMLQPGSCNPNAGSFKMECDASHHECTVPFTGGGVTPYVQTATPYADYSRKRCDGTSFFIEQQIHSDNPFLDTRNYPWLNLPPFNPAPAIYDAIHVKSAVVQNQTNVRTQTFEIDLEHTPFPNHELLVTYCGKTESVASGSYAATDTGPRAPTPLDPGNLGTPNASGIAAKNIRMSLKRNATCNTVTRIWK
jgi:hypothetical protein